jgi:hypothetical protein
MECENGNAWVRSGCIFTYNGSTLDIALNYSVFLINVIYCTASLENRKVIASGVFLGVVAFQWILCLILGCSGISIIWCAMCGWSMNQRRCLASSRDVVPDTRFQSATETIRRMYPFVMLLDGAVIVYYSVVTEVITTVAHICALILGAALYHCFASNGMARPVRSETPLGLNDGETSQPYDM